MSSSMSAYELERLKTIEANQAELTRLGLDKPLGLKKLKPSKKRKVPSASDADPAYQPPLRRTTRVSGPTTSTKDASSDASSDTSSDNEDIPLPVRVKKEGRSLPKPAPPPPPSASDAALCIVVEGAKTGRSKCRRCLEPLQMGVTRVGMESWMVGRQVIVWQHPTCFFEGVHISTETSGRGKCKQSKLPFTTGELRLSVTAHTTTNHFKLAAGATLLRPVVAAAEVERAALDSVEGIGALDAGERSALERDLFDATASSPSVVSPHSLEFEETPSTDKAMADGTLAMTKSEKGQPAKGLVANSSGKVCWLFAGHECYGTLLPKQESKTHCYAVTRYLSRTHSKLEEPQGSTHRLTRAPLQPGCNAPKIHSFPHFWQRTHKGNTKTLTKGAASWWVLD